MYLQNITAVSKPMEMMRVTPTPVIKIIPRGWKAAQVLHIDKICNTTSTLALS
jgi:hypothetical protein